MLEDAHIMQLSQGFSRLSRAERFRRLEALGVLTAEDIAFLEEGGVRRTDLAENLIENVIGYFQLPLGVATHFRIDGRDYVIPLAVEETSIIAALSKTAKWIKHQGEITTWVSGECIIGQIQLAQVRDFAKFTQIIMANKQFLIEKVNEDVAANMVKRGGGVRDLTVRELQDAHNNTMAVIHITMNSCEAMGANILNQVLEYLKSPIEKLTHEKVSMCILSNLNDTKITHARVVIRDVPEDLGTRIEHASLFAEADAYRAATHNKGVMNGIDPVLIATGNDWRAVEAAVHSYATRHGRYSAISTWRYQDKQLIGQFSAPVVVGIVGGVTALHPTAKMCLRMLKVTSANHLSRIIAAVGLVQNLGALKALCTEGIIQGHMKLHIDNLLLSAGATGAEVSALKPELEALLAHHKRLSLADVTTKLAHTRQRAVK